MHSMCPPLTTHTHTPTHPHPHTHSPTPNHPHPHSHSRVTNHDAAFVSRIKACGAVLLGKTSMHELGIGTTGLNVAWGTPANPYSTPGTHRYTGASSSGSAAAVALGLCPFALGILCLCLVLCVCAWYCVFVLGIVCLHLVHIVNINPHAFHSSTKRVTLPPTPYTHRK